MELPYSVTRHLSAFTLPVFFVFFLLLLFFSLLLSLPFFSKHDFFHDSALASIIAGFDFVVLTFKVTIYQISII